MGSEPETFSDAYEIATDDLETLDHRELYRYRSSRVKELAFAHQAPSSLPRDVRLRSIKSEQVAIINFHNVTELRARALWIDFHGHEIAYSIIEPGEKKRYRTYVTHPWIIRDVVTAKRLILNASEAVFGKIGTFDVVIRKPPLLQWTVRTNKYFSKSFKERVRCLLLIHNRMQKQDPKDPASSSVEMFCEENYPSGVGRERSVFDLGKLPIMMIQKMAHYMSLDAPTNQTLLRGLQAAPDLIPIELPEDVPTHLFLPNDHHFVPFEDSDSYELTFSDMESESDISIHSMT